MRKEYFTDDRNKVKYKRHGNSDWDLVALHGWNGETKAFKCSHCGEISKADYARCPVCGMIMFHKMEEDDKC